MSSTHVLQTSRLLLSYEPEVDTFDWVGAGRCGVYVIWLRGHCIGAVSLTGIARPTGEIGYEVDEPHRGQGFASEALVAVVEAALIVHGYSLLTARVVAENVASRRVLEKSGFAAVAARVKWLEPDARPATVLDYRRIA